MNIIFFGSDDFAATHLNPLAEAGHTLIACVTQPDRPKGRGMNVIISPIKEWAQKNNVQVLQPTDLKEEAFLRRVEALKADIFVVIAYGRFLPEQLLAMPRHGAINLHGSLLPKYRGAAPINWVIINGERKTGITIIRVSKQMDAGDILASTSIEVGADETSVILREKMMAAGPLLLNQTLALLEDKEIECHPQNHAEATFAPKLTKELGAVLWSNPASDIYNLIRGLLPWPMAYTFYNGEFLKILESEVVVRDISGYNPGTIFELSKQGILVATGKNGLLLKQVHLQNTKQMSAHSFAIGHGVEVGMVLE